MAFGRALHVELGSEGKELGRCQGAGACWLGNWAEGLGAVDFTVTSGHRTNLPFARRGPDFPGALFRRSRNGTFGWPVVRWPGIGIATP